MRFRDISAFAVMLGCGVLCSAAPSVAQSVDDRTPALDVAPAPETAQDIDAAAASGPTIYVIDKNRRLATINLGTKAVHIIGTTGPTLTDLAFNPKSHALYGISFSALYAVDRKTAATRFIGNLGTNDANALVFDSTGVAYSAGVSSGDLYRVSAVTGRYYVVGSTGGYGSAGDLTFYNDRLLLAGFHGTRSVGPATTNYLLTLNPKTGAHIGEPIQLPIKEVFGLVSTGKNELYGLALYGSSGAALYKLAPTETVVSKRATLVETLSNRGLSLILGAAYDGNYQP